MLKRKSKVVVSVLLLMFALGMLGGCASKTKTTGDTANNTIKVASVTPLSGPQAAVGENIKLGAQMAFEEQQASIEALGFKLEFDPQDDQADPKVGVAVAQKLVADADVLAVDGHYNSGVAIPSSELYTKDNLCMVSPANTATGITDRKLPDVNRICARDDVQGPLDADFAAKDLGAKTIFIIQDKTTYGQGIADEVKAQSAVDGMTVLGYEGITAGESDFSAVLNKVAVAKPDVVFFGGMFPEGSLLIKQMADKGIKAKFIGPDGMDDPEVIKIAGDAAIGTYYSSPAADISRTPEGKAWQDKFTAKFGKAPSNWTAYGYDAMNVIMAGIKKAIVDNGGKKPTRLQVSTAIRATSGYQGLTSLIAFDDKGDNKGCKLYIAQFKTATYPPTVIKEVNAYK